MKFLVNFIRKQNLMNFCLAELESLCEMKNIKIELDYKNFNVEKDWVHYIDVPIEVAEFICTRSVLTKNIIKVVILLQVF
jgi:hypothetical protein